MKNTLIFKFFLIIGLIFSPGFNITLAHNLETEPVRQEYFRIAQMSTAELIQETASINTESEWEGRLIEDERTSKIVGWILLGLVILGGTIWLMKL